MILERPLYLQIVIPETIFTRTSEVGKGSKYRKSINLRKYCNSKCHLFSKIKHRTF